MPNSNAFRLGNLLGPRSTILATSLAEDAVGGGSVTTYATAAALPLSGNTTGDQAFVSETGRLYIFTGAGWYNIALINTNPNISSGANASYSLNIDGTPTVITLVANDPEGIPITWSYAVTSGSLTNGGGTSATVTQVDNEFTITPSTNQTYEGVFDITFTASDGVNLATSASTFSLAWVTPTVEYLVVAGGGSGGYGIANSSGGGGGGAGGLLAGTAAIVGATGYTIIVGSGGAAQNNTPWYGNNGSNSSAFGQTAIGGGGGGGTNFASFIGQNGGSGGGASSYNGSGTAGSGTVGQGNNGGPISGNFTAPNYPSGGGGGAGAPGGAVTSTTTAGSGGAGLSSSISGSLVYYAGGGGGATYNGGTTGVGGIGGGGTAAGIGGGAGGSGIANTGGGGGGVCQYGNNSGAGGSGIVILRYADTFPPAASTTGSPTITVAGGYRVYKFTQSGSITF